MAQSDFIGTITLDEGETGFTIEDVNLVANQVLPGDEIRLPGLGLVLTIGEVTSATEGELTDPCPAAADGEHGCRIRLQPAMSRYTAQVRNLVQQLDSGNLTALAALDGEAGLLPIFTSPGVLGLISRAEMTEGLNYNAAVNELSDRDAYDFEVQGFSVLVANVGDGRAALFSKESVEEADWSDPAYITGGSTTITVAEPVVGDFGTDPDVETSSTGPGEMTLTFTLPAGPNFETGDIETGAPGSEAELTLTPITGGYQMDGSIPAGRGFYPRGEYDPMETYATDDVVLYDGSTWIALGETTGNAPPTLPTTSNTWWALVAASGRSLHFEGAYDSGSAYSIDSIVTDQGASWISLRAVDIGNAPPTLPTTSNDDWQMFAAGGANGEMTGPVSSIAGNVAVFADGTGDAVMDGGPMRMRNLPEITENSSFDIEAANAGFVLVFDGSEPGENAELPALSASGGEAYFIRNGSFVDLTVLPNGTDDIEGAEELVLLPGQTAMIWPAADKSDWRAAVWGSSPVAADVGFDNTDPALPGAPSSVQDAIEALASGRIVQLQISTHSGAASDNTNTWQPIHNNMRVSITPTRADSTILVIAFCGGVGASTGAYVGGRIVNQATSTVLLQGSAVGSRTQSGAVFFPGGVNGFVSGCVVGSETAGSTTARLYALEMYANSGTLYLNRTGQDNDSAGYMRTSSMIVALEIAA